MSFYMSVRSELLMTPSLSQEAREDLPLSSCCLRP